MCTWSCCPGAFLHGRQSKWALFLSLGQKWDVNVNSEVWECCRSRDYAGYERGFTAPSHWNPSGGERKRGLGVMRLLLLVEEDTRRAEAEWHKSSVWFSPQDFGILLHLGQEVAQHQNPFLPEGSWIVHFIDLMGKGTSCLNSSWSYKRAFVASNCTDFERICSSNTSCSSRAMADTGCGGLSSALCHCQCCGLWKLPHQMSGGQMLVGAKCSIFVIHIPHCHLSQLWPPPLFWWLCQWFSSLASYMTANTAERGDDLSEFHITQTCCCLRMDLERKGNFNLFFIHKVKDVGGSYFSCIVFLLGKGSRSSPPNLPGNEEERGPWSGEGTFACNYSSLFPVRHQRTCWCYWRHITVASASWSIPGEESSGEELEVIRVCVTTSSCPCSTAQGFGRAGEASSSFWSLNPREVIHGEMETVLKKWCFAFKSPKGLFFSDDHNKCK